MITTCTVYKYFMSHHGARPLHYVLATNRLLMIIVKRHNSVVVVDNSVRYKEALHEMIVYYILLQEKARLETIS